MIAGITEEIQRLEFTIWGCRKNNPFNLNIEFMEKCAKALRAYRDLHFDEPMPAFQPPED